MANVDILRRRVKALQKKPQPEQRTDEWFKARHTRITASEAASCFKKTHQVCEDYVNEFGITNFKYNDNESLNPYEKKEDYIIKKCESFYGTAFFKDNIYTLWGKKYEDIATRLYTKLYNQAVLSFGLISHSRLKWLAASPDGITEDGIMLEIKCPKSRKIDPKVPPLYYWIQCQIQLECCNLEECHFLECEIEECPLEEFVNFEPHECQSKGIVLEEKNTLEPSFIYPPPELDTTEDYLRWAAENNTNRTVSYFKIMKYNVNTIKRSKLWFDKNKADIKSTWEIIMNLLTNKEDFDKYKESIMNIRNKSFMDKFHNTNCLITDCQSIDTPFVIETLIPTGSQSSGDYRDQNVDCMISD
jgi:putative phage-type endonuclease